MKHITRILTIISLLIAACTPHIQAQTGYCSLWPRFDQEIFTTVTKTADVVFGANLDYQGVNMVLKMDVYRPAGDTMSKRPLIILAHGGSFVAGDKSNQDQADLCNHFAKRGYVCATINYRLGFGFPINAATATNAVYRAVQDMKAAIRFFRQDAATVDTFKIDPNIIFAGGTSAGAFTALHLAYLNTYPELPATVDTTALGDLEGNSGNPGYPSNVNAVINLCGALGNANWVIAGDPPLVSMHGTSDATVPYSNAMLLLFNLYPLMVVDGSYAIHNYINTFNHPAEMYTWYGQGHVPFNGTGASNIAYMDTTIRFVSNFLYKYFGCAPSNPNPVQNTFTTSGVGELANSNEIIVGNNPADEYVNIYKMGNEDVRIILLNSTGQVVFEVEKMTDNQFVLPVKHLAAGLYFLHYKGVDKTGVLKLVVQH